MELYLQQCSSLNVERKLCQNAETLLLWLDVNVDDERIDIAVEYGLDVNHEATADCRIAMSIRPKAQAEEAISGK